MGSEKEKNQLSSIDKIDLILETVISLKKDIDMLDSRISRIEINFNLPKLDDNENESSKFTNVVFCRFEELDDHLKRTYQILADENKPMTASEVAERMGRSRSTTSYHLNQLEKLNFLEKVPSPEGKARHVFFQAKSEDD